jgi:hypothetical protein
MTYMILDSTGSAINAFDDALSARAALRAIVAEDADAAEHLFLLAYDDGGNVVGDAVTFADLPAQTAEIEDSALVIMTHTIACYRDAPLRYAPARPVGIRQRGNVAGRAAA